MAMAGAAGVAWATVAKLHSAAESESMSFFIGMRESKGETVAQTYSPQMKKE